MKSFFKISRLQQVGIISLLLLIIVLQLLYYKLDFSKPIRDINTPEIVKLQQEVDSLKVLKFEDSKPKIYPFNPNFITDYKAYQLGISTAAFDRLQAFRAQDKWINSPKQFQQVTKISDSLYNAIKVYFKFPDWVLKRNKNTKVKKLKNHTIRDLNTATSEQLQEVSGVGEKLAARILKYRKKLGGFIQDNQLYEVWYLDKDVANRVLEQFKVVSKPTIIKLNINNCSEDELKKVPYLYWKSAKAILTYRNEHAGISKLEELKNIPDFPVAKYDRLVLYLTLK